MSAYVGSVDSVVGGVSNPAQIQTGTPTTSPSGALQSYEGPVLFQYGRNINGIIIPNCAIEEVGVDELVLTEHPVEQGSTITDHAYKKPRQVTLRWGWTDSNPYGISCIDVYNQILSLQSQRTPLAVTTGKQVYSSMQFASIQQTTNATSENSLMLVVICREIIIVQTSTVTAPAPQEAQADPEKTAPTTNTGTKSPTPATVPTPSTSTGPTVAEQEQQGVFDGTPETGTTGAGFDSQGNYVGKADDASIDISASTPHVTTGTGVLTSGGS